MVDLKVLIKNGVQFGHQVWRWCPRMAHFIWGKKNGVHLIDVSKTAFQLERAAKFLEEVASEGKQILWVGTKRAAQDVIEETAKKLDSPFVRNRWIGGTLTNFSQVKKSVTKLLHYEDILSKTDQYAYTKKEFGTFQKIVDRLESNVGGIRDLAWPIGAVVIVDARKEAVAIKEAIAAGIPVVGLVDTNNDPSGIDYVIPGNDDVARAIRVIIDELAVAVEAGKKNAGKKQKEAAEKAQVAEELAAKEVSAEKKPAAKKEAAPKAPAKKVETKKTEVKAEEATEKAAAKKAAPKASAKKAPTKTTAKKTAAKKPAAKAVKKADKTEK